MSEETKNLTNLEDVAIEEEQSSREYCPEEQLESVNGGGAASDSFLIIAEKSTDNSSVKF